jgi:protein tyrosine phosphatase
MTFKDLQENNLVYAYLDNKLIRTYKFKNWLDNKRANLYDLEKLNDVVITVANINQPFASIQTSRGLVKLSTREIKLNPT